MISEDVAAKIHSESVESLETLLNGIDQKGEAILKSNDEIANHHRLMEL